MSGSWVWGMVFVRRQETKEGMRQEANMSEEDADKTDEDGRTSLRAVPRIHGEVISMNTLVELLNDFDIALDESKESQRNVETLYQKIIAIIGDSKEPMETARRVVARMRIDGSLTVSAVAKAINEPV
jgi:hypothetical protein